MRTLALGADVCNSARGMMFALGCIQVSKIIRFSRVTWVGRVTRVSRAISASRVGYSG